MPIGTGRSLTAARTSFNPKNLSSALIFLEADVGVSFDGSNNVSQWNDQTVHGFNVTPSAVNATHAPLYSASGGPNNRPYITYTTDTAQALSNGSFPALAYPYQAFAVVRYSARTTGINSIIYDAGDVSFMYIDTLGNWELLYNSQNVNGSGPSSNTDHCVEEVFNDNTHASVVYVDNVLSNALVLNLGAQAVTGTITIGNHSSPTTSSWSGRIYSILICNALLSASDKAQVVAYFHNKWGVP